MQHPCHSGNLAASVRQSFMHVLLSLSALTIKLGTECQPATTILLSMQVDLSKCESALGTGHVGAGPSLFASPSAPLPCHGSGPRGEHVIAAGFAHTPDLWSSVSATALACSDNGCGQTMAQQSAAHLPAVNLTGVNSGLAILSSLFTRTNFHVEDLLLGAYNVMSFGAPKIWYEHSPFCSLFALDCDLHCFNISLSA